MDPGVTLVIVVDPSSRRPLICRLAFSHARFEEMIEGNGVTFTVTRFRSISLRRKTERIIAGFAFRFCRKFDRRYRDLLEEVDVVPDGEI